MISQKALSSESIFKYKILVIFSIEKNYEFMMKDRFILHEVIICMAKATIGQKKTMACDSIFQ